MSGPSRDLVEALYRLRVTLTAREQRAALRAVERVVYEPRVAPEPDALALIMAGFDAVDAEREACAKIADGERAGLDPEDDSAARHTALVIAAGIRARGAR